MNLKTFECVVEGKNTQEKAVSLHELYHFWDMMGMDRKDVKVIREITESNSSQSKPEQQIPRRIDLSLKEPVNPKTFSWKDGKNEYRLENGILMKKTWKKTSMKSLIDKGIRIKIRNENDETLKAKEYTIELEEWIEISQN